MVERNVFTPCTCCAMVFRNPRNVPEASGGAEGVLIVDLCR
jgi:hypothetical protein